MTKKQIMTMIKDIAQLNNLKEAQLLEQALGALVKNNTLLKWPYGTEDK